LINFYDYLSYLRCVGNFYNTHFITSISTNGTENEDTDLSNLTKPLSQSIWRCSYIFM